MHCELTTSSRPSGLPLLLACLLASAFAGHVAAAAPGSGLGVSIMRSGDDQRQLLSPGQTITLSVGVGNLRGDVTSPASVLIVTLPEGLKFNQAQPGPDKAEPTTGETNLVWDLGTVPAGAFPRLFDLDVTAAAGLRPPAELAVSARVEPSGGPPQGKSRRVTLILEVEPATAKLTVQSNLAAVPITVGAPITFTAEISNLGTITAADTALTLALPSKVSLQSSDPPSSSTDPNRPAWQLGPIAPGSSHSVAVTISLPASLGAAAFTGEPEGRLKFSFDASTSTTPNDPQEAHLDIDKQVAPAQADLKVWLNVEGADEPGELPIGKDVTYTIMYGNFGNVPAPNAAVSLSLPGGLSLVQAKPPPQQATRSERFAGGVSVWNAGDLAIGQSSVIKSQIHVASVPEEGSLVMATLAAPGVISISGESTAYSWQHAALTGSRRSPQAAARGSSAWHLTLAAIAAAALFLLLRAMLRRRSG